MFGECQKCGKLDGVYEVKGKWVCGNCTNIFARVYYRIREYFWIKRGK